MVCQSVACVGHSVSFPNESVCWGQLPVQCFKGKIVTLCFLFLLSLSLVSIDVVDDDN